MTMKPRYGLFLLSLLLTGCATSQLAPNTPSLIHFSNGICQESQSGRMWQEEAGPAVSSWNEAEYQATRLNLGGYSDWRLPTKDELYSLLVLCDLNRQENCPKGLLTGHWLGRSPEEGEAGYWESYPLCGGVDYRFVHKQEGVVRAVRP